MGVQVGTLKELGLFLTVAVFLLRKLRGLGFLGSISTLASWGLGAH